MLAVGLPDLPPPKSVLKPSPEAPPGKIVHEVIETTHFKVQQAHTMGVSSFVLTSETVRDNKAAGATRREEMIKVTDVHGGETMIPVEVPRRDLEDGELERRMKEVSGSLEEEVWRMHAAKQAIKGFI